MYRPQNPFEMNIVGLRLLLALFRDLQLPAIVFVPCHFFVLYRELY